MFSQIDTKSIIVHIIVVEHDVMHGMEEGERGQARPKRTYSSHALQSGQGLGLQHI